jgi:hypothetical protein
MAVLLALAVLAITLALAYAAARASLTTFKTSAHEQASLRARNGARDAAELVLAQFADDPNWMPAANPVSGILPSGDPYQADVQVTGGGAGRRITATAEVLDPRDHHLLAQQVVTVGLTKQRLNNLPTSAVTSLGSHWWRPRNRSSRKKYRFTRSGPTVYAASEVSIHGDIVSSGTITLQKGIDFNGDAYVLGDIAVEGLKPANYLNYRPAWGTAYPAQVLRGSSLSSGGTLRLAATTLGPSAANPMGVYYFAGDLEIDDDVTIDGSLVVVGSVSIQGRNVRISGLEQATDPDTGTVHKTAFPSMVVDGNIVLRRDAEAVRLSGVIMTSSTFRRERNSSGSSTQRGNNGNGSGNGGGSVPGASPDLASSEIYINGAIMADRVSIENAQDRRTALVFDVNKADVTDAPGFFTWRVSAWTESN